ncbi:MAG: exodeoxyribonuclease VII small subunit [Acidobacteriota bacterium]
MPRAKRASKEPSFEAALSRLEEIVKDLESGDRSLEESLGLFEEGVRLTRLCASRLDQAQRRIDLLTSDERGQPSLVPFETPDEGQGPERGEPEER